MPSRSSRKTNSITRQAVELAVAVPQVVAHRVTRMAMSGPTLSERDRKEFTLMVAEKKAAFTDAWQAMAVQSVVAQQALAMSLLRSVWLPSARGKSTVNSMATQLQSAALGVLGKGLAPLLSG